MKCPNCEIEQRYKESMICHSCGYRFKRLPRRLPKVSDAAIKQVINLLAGFTQYHFTYQQLYVQVYHLVRENRRKKRGLQFLGALLIAIVWWGLKMGPLAGFFQSVPWLFWGVELPAAALAIASLRPIRVSHVSVLGLISTYHFIHAVDFLADGRKYETFEVRGLDRTNQPRYTPEKVLIVEHDDVAEMLLLNRFHLQYKVLVMSESKYPRQMFAAYQGAREARLPVFLAHDASQNGLSMKARVLADPQWDLTEDQVRDLGLYPDEVQAGPIPLVWIPEPDIKKSSERKSLNSGDPRTNIRQGYRMPFDLLPPEEMLRHLALAMNSHQSLISGKRVVSEDASEWIGLGRTHPPQAMEEAGAPESSADAEAVAAESQPSEAKPPAQSPESETAPPSPSEASEEPSPPEPEKPAMVSGVSRDTAVSPESSGAAFQTEERTEPTEAAKTKTPAEYPSESPAAVESKAPPEYPSEPLAAADGQAPPEYPSEPLAAVDGEALPEYPSEPLAAVESKSPQATPDNGGAEDSEPSELLEEKPAAVFLETEGLGATAEPGVGVSEPEANDASAANAPEPSDGEKPAIPAAKTPIPGADHLAGELPASPWIAPNPSKAADPSTAEEAMAPRFRDTGEFKHSDFQVRRKKRTEKPQAEAEESKDQTEAEDFDFFPRFKDSQNSINE